MERTLEIYDSNDIQYRPAFRGLKFSKVWQGGEDTALSFALDRSSAIEWPDVGYGYLVILRHGLTALWRGYMRGIDQGMDEIAITAIGTWILLDDFPYVGGVAPVGETGRLWCDTRYGRCTPCTNDDNAAFADELYQMDNQNRLWITPRKNESFSASYIGAFKYVCRYATIKRITFSYDFVDPDNWLLALGSMDADRSNWNTEWSITATASGSQDITLTTARARLEFHLYYNASKAQYTGETGEDCYAKITSLKIYGTSDTTPTVTDVANDIIDQVQAISDIEDDHTEVETIALTLEPLFYENGEKCLDALQDAASYGDANNKAIAWGVESGGTRVFVRAPDRDSVRYVVPASHCRRLSARGEAYRGYCSAATGRYTDEEGEMQFTSKYYVHVTPTGIVANTTSTGDDLASTVYGVHRETIVDFGRVSSTLATEFIKRYVIGYGHPQVQGTFEVEGEVQDLQRGGAWVMPFELETGYLVQIPRFRAVEAEGASGADLREWDTTFLLSGLEWDETQKVARLIPEGAPDDLQRLMDFLRRFREGREEEELQKRPKVLGM